MFIRDVNSYIAERTDGTIKRIGAYCYGADFLKKDQWHKDFSSQIVAKAAEAALVRGEDVETVVKNHRDPFDFMLATKIKNADVLIMRDHWDDDIDTTMQRVTRYYVSHKGGHFFKQSPPKEGCTIGQWKRKNGLTDYEYVTARAALSEIPKEWFPADMLDTTGVPWSPEINTKNKSKYDDRETAIHASWIVTECNQMSTFDRDNLNYDYYIAEANKLVEGLR